MHQPPLPFQHGLYPPKVGLFHSNVSVYVLHDTVNWHLNCLSHALTHTHPSTFMAFELMSPTV